MLSLREETAEKAIMSLKNVVAFSLVVALGVILIIHFVMFWIYGGVFIYEDNRVILALETLMSITIIGFGLERLISTYRNQSKLSTDTSTQENSEELNPSAGSFLYPPGSDSHQIPTAS